MSYILSLATVILAAIIHALLQLGIGTELLLYHASLGKHIRKKTRQLVSSYISGIGYITILGLAAACFILSFIFTEDSCVAILTTICCALALIGIISWFVYFRVSSGTELWIPQVVARYIDSRARTTSNNTEAFSLGLLTYIGELPFSFVLIVAAASAILELPFQHQLFALAIYAIIVLLPVSGIRFFIRHGKTVVEVQRWRVKHKKFFRILIGAAFAVLAAFIFSFRVLQ